MTQLKVPKGKNKTTLKNSKEFCIWWTYVSKCRGTIPHLDKTWANLLSRKLHYKNAKWPSLEQRWNMNGNFKLWRNEKYQKWYRYVNKLKAFFSLWFLVKNFKAKFLIYCGAYNWSVEFIRQHYTKDSGHKQNYADAKFLRFMK